MYTERRANSAESAEIRQEFLAMYADRRSNPSESPEEHEAYYRHEIFEMMVNRASEIIILFTVDNNTANYVSPNIERLLGIPAAALKEDFSLLDASLVEPEGPLTEARLLKSAANSGEGRLRKHIHQKTGQPCWFQEHVLRGRFKDSKKFLLLLSDRTNEIVAREQLEQSLSIAKSALEGRSNFLANMSHDIRTPMNAIIGFSHLLDQEWQFPDKVREYSRKISSSSKHLLSLINDLLDMSRIESGKTIINVSEFSFPKFLEDLRLILTPQFNAKHLDFEMQVKDVHAELLLGDKTRLNQILMNILSNSIKYTPDGGSIRFTITQLERSSRRFCHLRFEIADSGIGMSPEFVEHVFDTFAREKNTTLSGIAGTGLGLSIAKNLVDLMGGTIHIQSQQGVGTTVTVELALQLSDHEAEERFWEEQGITRLLSVDDDENIVREIKIAMSHTNVEIHSANSGETALQTLRTAQQRGNPYNIILLDWNMPGMDGLETARRIREDLGIQVPILLLTAHDWTDIEEQARQAGINGFLSKPFFITNFQQAVVELNPDTGAQESPEPESEPNAAEPEDLESAQKEDPDSAQNVLDGLRILAAEDNELNAEILCEVLNMEGAECDLAENGQIAVNMFNASKPGYYDAILMDIMMPVMDGHQAAREIRASRHPDAKRIPIAAMTANAFAEDVQAALDAGMNAHIAKPLDLDVLKTKLFRILKRK